MVTCLLFSRSRLAAAALIAAALIAAAPAAAGTFQISPTRLELPSKGSSAVVTLTNTDVEAVRLQAKVFAWSQSPSGEQELVAAPDLVVFPTLFTLAPGESRRVKVGITVGPQARERTYRLFLEELPPPASRGVGLRVLTRLSVPIFQAPLREVRAGAISRVAMVGGKLGIDVRNQGTVSVMLKSARAVATDAAGAVVWQGEASGWYLLAGGLRTFELEVPAEQAARVAAVEVEALTDQGGWKQRVALAATSSPGGK